MSELLARKGIHQLIAELCPDGVERKKLGLAMKPKTEGITADRVDENAFVTTENLLPDIGGIKFPAAKPKSGSFRTFMPGDILVSNIRPYLRKIWTADRAGATSGGDVYIIRASDVGGLNVRFLYHCLSSERFFDYATAHSSGGKMPRGNKDSIRKYLIPLPPLPVQEAIVAYLDKFSQLEAQLEAELEAELARRKKQYEWYRMHLLDFKRQDVDDEGKPTGVILDYQYGDEYHARPAVENIREMTEKLCPDGVEWKKLGELVHRNKGTNITAGEMKKLSQEKGLLVFGGGKTQAFVEESKIPKKDIITDPSILVKSRGVVGFEYVIVPFTHKQELWSYTAKHVGVNLRYLFHYLTIQEKQLNAEAKGRTAAMPQISLTHTEDMPVPIPPIAVQEDIVKILDEFDTLVNDMSAGIPAEIIARRKQYEYYREQLLAFDKKKVGETTDE